MADPDVVRSRVTAWLQARASMRDERWKVARVERAAAGVSRHEMRIVVATPARPAPPMEILRQGKPLRA